MFLPHPWKQALPALALAVALCAAQAQEAQPPPGGEPPPDTGTMAAPPEGEAPPPEAPAQAADAPAQPAAAAPAEEAPAQAVYQNDAQAAPAQTDGQSANGNGAQTGRRSRRNGGQPRAETTAAEAPAPAVAPQGEPAPESAPVAEVVPMAATGALAHTTTASYTEQGPEDSLVSASPFLSPLYAMRPRATGLMGVRPAGSVEFRGAVCLNGQWQFSLYDPREKRGFWVRMDDETSPYRVTAYNQEANSVSLNVNGIVSEVPLNRPVDTPLAIASAAGAPRAAAAQAGNRQANAQGAAAQTGNRQAAAQGAGNQGGNRQAAAQGANAQRSNTPASGVYVGGQSDSAGVQTTAPAQPAAQAAPAANTARPAAATGTTGASTRRRIALPNQ